MHRYLMFVNVCGEQQVSTESDNEITTALPPFLPLVLDVHLREREVRTSDRG